MKNDEKQVLLDVKNLKKYFNVGNKKILKAVDDISLQIYKGETLGLVGESGCGKSTFGRTVIHLYDPTDGTVTFDGTKIDKNLDTKQRHELCRRMQMIFQDPYASLNPRRKILDIVAEGIDALVLLPIKKNVMPRSLSFWKPLVFRQSMQIVSLMSFPVDSASVLVLHVHLQ